MEGFDQTVEPDFTDQLSYHKKESYKDPFFETSVVTLIGGSTDLQILL